MTPVRAVLIGSAACAALVMLAACSGQCAPSVRDGWVRWLPVDVPTTAGFGRIENPCRTAAVIVAASSPEFSDVSLHQTRTDGGVTRMRAVPELHVAAGDAVVLEPGGLHLMMMGPQAALQPGGTIRVEFALRGGGTLRGEMEVRAAQP